jgi:hypothetical protein
MPRTCLAWSSPERLAIDEALVQGEPLRNIAQRVSISAAGLLRHKNHVAQSIVRASEKREELLGDSVLDGNAACSGRRGNCLTGLNPKATRRRASGSGSLP